jgi:para-aminobenzoate synthetase component 1
MRQPVPFAYFPRPGGDPADGLLATGLAEVAHDPAALDRPGWWAVVGGFEGEWTCARFTELRRAALPVGVWTGPAPDSWHSSLDQEQYERGVRQIRRSIAAGYVYQANLCRVLSAPLMSTNDAMEADTPAGLARRLMDGNPAPYAGVIDLPGHGVRVVSASPELFLRRDGDLVASSPIKGTGRTEADLLPKDTAENVMIVDLVRNDLAQVAQTGSVDVTELCAVEKHPGLVHLVSTVAARLRPGTTWPRLLAATFPPGSVSGAPKRSALRIIEELETAARGPYCGAIGWVDNRATENRPVDHCTAQLAVGIRTFWIEAAVGSSSESGGTRPTLLKFGTGAGITWGSDPLGEWRETELKAARLIALASGPAG